MMLRTALLASLLAATCTPPPAPTPTPTPTPTPEPSPAPVPPVQVPPPPSPAPLSGCPAACARLEVLGCDAAKPTAAGAPCSAVCQGIVDSGTITYPTACVAAAKSCPAAEACFR